MLHIRQSVYLVLTTVLSTLFLVFHITFNEIRTTLSIQFWYKGILDTCGAMTCSYFGVTFLLFYKDRECCLHILPKQRTFVHYTLMDWFLTS